MDHTTEEMDGVTVIRPVGDLDVTTALDLRALLGEQLTRERVRIVLDLSEVPFIDSSGVGVLVTANRRSHSAGGALALAALSPGVAKVLELTRALRVLTVTDTVEEAVQRLAAET
jgi:anti-sigma B factor antagonist